MQREAATVGVEVVGAHVGRVVGCTVVAIAARERALDIRKEKRNLQLHINLS